MAVATTTTDPSRTNSHPVAITQRWPKTSQDAATTTTIRCRSVAEHARPEVAQLEVSIAYLYPRATRTQSASVLLDRLAAEALRDELNRALAVRS